MSRETGALIAAADSTGACAMTVCTSCVSSWMALRTAPEFVEVNQARGAAARTLTMRERTMCPKRTSAKWVTASATE